jgi:2-polyprenyl-3-methyl-5-hydroxy-6-metoxy-1,4-benzoquinol methylase
VESASPSADRREALVGRLTEAALSTMELCCVYVGDRLGLYRALRSGLPTTAAELAVAADIDPRYAREWLEQQAVAGILEVDSAADPEAQRYSLPAEHAEVLLDRDSLNWFAPVVQLVVGITRPLPALLEAFRSGGGISWSAFGADPREGQAGQNRPAFLKLLGTEWLPAIPDIHARLAGDPPARIADVACGAAWSSIAMARAYPKVRVDGFDSDEASVALARANVAEAGLAGRVTISTRDAGDPALVGRYDLVTIFEALHDMSRPVEALRTVRGLLAEGGAVLVMDERVAETFTAPGDAIERMMYGFSVLCCLPTGLAEQPSAGTGTVMRPATLRRYALEAGFGDVEILPIANDLFRFYRLHVRGPAGT